MCTQFRHCKVKPSCLQRFEFSECYKIMSFMGIGGDTQTDVSYSPIL